MAPPTLSSVRITKGAGPEIEISKGLIGGEDLIISPPQSLQDGDQVKTKER